MARNKVKTNPQTRSNPRKVKDVMTHGETQGVARSPSCCRRMKVNLRESHIEPKGPVVQPRPRETQPIPAQHPAAGPVHRQVALGRPRLGQDNP